MYICILSIVIVLVVLCLSILLISNIKNKTTARNKRYDDAKNAILSKDRYEVIKWMKIYDSKTYKDRDVDLILLMGSVQILLYPDNDIDEESIAEYLQRLELIKNKHL